VTFHHNLWAYHNARNPRLGDNYGKPPFPTFDFRNNVIYDYGDTCSGLTGDRLDANYVANYIRPGADSNLKRAPIVLSNKCAVRYYIEGNVVEGEAQWTEHNETMFTPLEHEGRRLVEVVAKPFDAPVVRTTSARQAREDVLSGVGATLPVRDAVDARVIRQVRERTGRIINSQSEVGGWPEYRSRR
jgi:hypothetical protein